MTLFPQHNRTFSNIYRLIQMLVWVSLLLGLWHLTSGAFQLYPERAAVLFRIGFTFLDTTGYLIIATLWVSAYNLFRFGSHRELRLLLVFGVLHTLFVALNCFLSPWFSFLCWLATLVVLFVFYYPLWLREDFNPDIDIVRVFRGFYASRRGLVHAIAIVLGLSFLVFLKPLALFAPDFYAKLPYDAFRLHAASGWLGRFLSLYLMAPLLERYTSFVSYVSLLVFISSGFFYARLLGAQKSYEHSFPLLFLVMTPSFAYFFLFPREEFNVAIGALMSVVAACLFARHFGKVYWLLISFVLLTLSVTVYEINIAVFSLLLYTFYLKHIALQNMRWAQAGREIVVGGVFTLLAWFLARLLNVLLLPLLPTVAYNGEANPWHLDFFMTFIKPNALVYFTIIVFIALIVLQFVHYIYQQPIRPLRKMLRIFSFVLFPAITLLSLYIFSETSSHYGGEPEITFYAYSYILPSLFLLILPTLRHGSKSILMGMSSLLLVLFAALSLGVFDSLLLMSAQ